MINLLSYLIFNPTAEQIVVALTILRVSIGAITAILGIPKMGGLEVWQNLGTMFMGPLGIHFLPVLWGFLGFASQFFGGIALTLGFGTRFASFALVIMMVIAVLWHLKRGDSFTVYSFPLSLIFVYLTFMIIGSGPYSLESYLLTR
ncbi:MAG: DoxX family protein [Candidatus Babeliales bacterium]|nr:DoxX family protein [Candidatus Babeliales bacterium]